MNRRKAGNEIHWISSIINNDHLAEAIHESVSAALANRPHVNLGARTVSGVFGRSLDAASYDIKNDERGKLFLRLIEYGPSNPDNPAMLVSDNETTLSDPECGSCVQFIYSHMVNRFKGEIAELLALRPCLELIQSLQNKARLPSGVCLHWGEQTKERRRSRKEDEEWGPFAKGADGLITQKANLKDELRDSLIVHGLVEVKSYRREKKALKQIERHCARLQGGVKLGSIHYPRDEISFSESDIIRILVVPSSWKLSREMRIVKGSRGRDSLEYREALGEPINTQIMELDSNLWRITLAWSQEAIEQAAYEMTFWYMSQVGHQIFSRKEMPKGWEYMTPEEAGRNAIKMALYYLPLRPLTRRKELLAIRLYNIYSFGYPLGIDYARKRQMIWLKNGELVGLPLDA